MPKISKVDFIIVAAIFGNCIGWMIFSSVRANRSPVVLPARRIYTDSYLLITANKEELSGNKNAPFTLVEFADYECPPCKAANVRIGKFLAKYPRQLNFCFRNYLLQMH